MVSGRRRQVRISRAPLELRHNGGVAVTVVLADGFAGEVVEVVAGGRAHQVGPAETSLLTGMAGEVVVADGATGHDPDQIEVTVRVNRTRSPAPVEPRPRADQARSSEPDSPVAPGMDAPWTSYRLAQGDVLVLDLVDGQLHGRVMPGPVGFA